MDEGAEGDDELGLKRGWLAGCPLVKAGEKGQARQTRKNIYFPT